MNKFLSQWVFNLFFLLLFFFLSYIKKISNWIMSVLQKLYSKGRGHNGTRARGDRAKLKAAAERLNTIAQYRAQNFGVPKVIYPARVSRGNRMKEHKTFDPIQGPLAMANAFVSDGPVADATATGGKNAFTFGADSSAWCINQVPLGNSSITRVGRRLAITAVALRGSIFAGTDGTTASIALVLVWDRNPNLGAAIPPFLSVFTAQNPSSLTNKDNAPRFKILRRWQYAINGDENAANQTDNTRIVFDEFVKLKNKVTLFKTSDSDGSLPDMVEGSLLLYALGDKGLIATTRTAAPSLTIAARIYFDDN